MEQSLLNSILTQWGAPGAIICALGFALWQAVKKLNDVQEQRVSDAKALGETVNTFTRSMDALTAWIKGGRK